MSPVPTHETVELAVGRAGRAPSLHNSQPWRWVFDGSVLHLYSVSGRLLHAADPSGRQLLISCGVVLGHLRAALAAEGWDTRVAYFPDPAHHVHVATVSFERARFVTDADRDRANAIERRRTDRLPLLAPARWREFEVVLRLLVDPRDALLTVLPASTGAELARASRLVTSLRRHDTPYQAELHWWASDSPASAGIPPDARISAGERARVAVSRALPTTSAPDRRTEIAGDEAVVAVLSAGDTPEELVRCGEALSTVLLECTVIGYATCALTHLTELPPSRAVVRALTGRPEQPQILIRIGTAPADATPPPPTPRLPVSEIFEVVPTPPHVW
ncbi:Acg family FMN-binding oxidoreductase [Nocardia crassostreae]|uniref:Acg family FMN-binding oxidoreductase n=1 Tax=Nocardia crassostreae TaxID=53428 RepID=UPI00082AD0BB|nr:NAD(P)H nitroreductase [Nocardia crassostreae]